MSLTRGKNMTKDMYAQEQHSFNPALDTYTGPGANREHQPLREIAGRLLHLSYRDLEKLGGLLYNDYSETTYSDHRDFASGLLAVADKILTEKA